MPYDHFLATFRAIWAFNFGHCLPFLWMHETNQNDRDDTEPKPSRIASHTHANSNSPKNDNGYCDGCYLLSMGHFSLPFQGEIFFHLGSTSEFDSLQRLEKYSIRQGFRILVPS